MGTEAIIALTILVLALITAGVLIFSAARTLLREEKEQEDLLIPPHGHVVMSFHAKDPFWRTDQHGRYQEFNDGQRLYWSKDFDSDDVSS